jgi:hypothetical protein
MVEQGLVANAPDWGQQAQALESPLRLFVIIVWHDGRRQFVHLIAQNSLQSS